MRHPHSGRVPARHAHAVGQPDQGRAFAFDRQAAWENPRQCGKPAGGTRRFSDDYSPGISPAIRSITPAACSPSVITLGYNCEQGVASAARAELGRASG